MFRCYFCQKVTPPKTTRHSVVIETRAKQYSTRRRDQPKRGGFRNRDEAVQDRGGKGMEITREVDACPECAAKQHEVKTIMLPTEPSAETSE
jgi:hypothetical protein